MASNGKLSEGLQKASDKVKEVAGTPKGMLIMIIIVTSLLFIFVIIYIMFAMKSSYLKGKKVTTEALNLAKQDPMLVIDSAELPASMVGREFSYSFWIYIDNYDNTDAYKSIMFRGTSTDYTSGNPIIFMDQHSNSMYIVVRTKNSSLSATNGLGSILTNNYFLNQNISLTDANKNTHLITQIDYIPLQRWVHVAVVVDNKLFSVYLDGDIYSVKSIDEFKSSRTATIDRNGKVVDYNLIIDKTESSLNIGKFGSGSQLPSGYLGKVDVFNYGISVNDVKSLYNKGPLESSFLSWLGINQYGFRSPLYKMNEVQ